MNISVYEKQFQTQFFVSKQLFLIVLNFMLISLLKASFIPDGKH